MITNNKGISVAISWVLLIGLAVTLALIVTVWMKGFADKATRDITEDVEKDIRCSEMSLNAIRISPSCMQLAMNVTNRGAFTIKKVRIRGSSGGTEFDFPAPGLQPTETKTLNTNTDFTSTTEVSVTPITELKGKFIACIEREVRVSC